MSTEKENGIPKDDMLVVGLGASAGGLKPLQRFFSLLPEKTGMAFIVVIHLSPDHKSNMAELLQDQTALTVLQVKEQVELKAEHVYVVPPDKMLSVDDHHLKLCEPDSKHGMAAVDHLFRSLAEVKGKNGACVIFSGAGSDGTAGLKAVKEHEGFAIVQDPDEAQYRAMPINAVKTGMADKIMPVDDIVGELLEYRKNLARIHIPDSTNELQGKVKKLDRANSDLKNLMAAAEVGIIFVDGDYCVQQFTPPAADIFNLIDSDMGRPLADITHRLDYGDIMEDVKRVHENLEKIKKTVSTKDNRWYIMRLRPYRSTKDKIEGVVLTFVEFSEFRNVEEQLSRQKLQKTLANLGIYALEQHDLKTLMQRAIKVSCIMLELDCGVMVSLNKENGTFEMGVHSGCAKKNDPIPYDKTVDAGFALQTGEPAVVRNYTDEKRFSVSPFVAHMDVASGINIVIRGASDTYGILGFYTKEEREFSEMNINFIQSVANIVGMCIERNHNLQRLKETNRQLEEAMEQSREYQKEIIHNNLIERWQLGSYLHDNLAQLLVSMKMMMDDLGKKFQQMQLEVPAELGQMEQAIDSGISGIRDLSHDIIPVDIEEEGADHAFRFLLRQTQKLYGVNCRLEADDVIHKISDRKVASNLYHIVQEAVKNAVMHGEADNITISMKRSGGDLQLIIEDDGIGMLSSSTDTDGRGLRIMKHRIELLGGTFDIGERHCSENGTRLTCTISLKYLKERSQEA